MNRVSASLICAISAAVGRGIATSGGTGAGGPMMTGANPPRPPWPRPSAPGAWAVGAGWANAAPADMAIAIVAMTRIRRNFWMFMAGILHRYGDRRNRFVTR